MQGASVRKVGAGRGIMALGGFVAGNVGAGTGRCRGGGVTLQTSRRRLLDGRSGRVTKKGGPLLSSCGGRSRWGECGGAVVEGRRASVCQARWSRGDGDQEEVVRTDGGVQTVRRGRSREVADPGPKDRLAPEKIKGTRLPGSCHQDRAFRPEPPGEDSRGRPVRAGQTEQDSRDRPVKSGQPGRPRQAGQDRAFRTGRW